MTIINNILTVLFIVHATMSLEIFNRSEWHAAEPKSIAYINKTVEYVIIHHSEAPPVCFTKEKCIQAMLGMQRFHQFERGWEDIGYSFAVGGDGKVYEGRGFNVVGAHAPNYNNKSIGICLIGNWQAEVPPRNMLQTAQDLIAHAIDEGYLSNEYTLYGHRQVRNTDCPGEALFNEIKTWPHFGEKTSIGSN